MNKIEYNELLVDHNTVILILLCNNIAIGQLTYNSKDDCLYNLIITVDMRNKGYATCLLKEAIERYKPQYINASTGYGSGLNGLVKLYSEVGFVPYEVRMRRKI